jgi:hypothetical protein
VDGATVVAVVDSAALEAEALAVAAQAAPGKLNKIHYKKILIKKEPPIGGSFFILHFW